MGSGFWVLGQVLGIGLGVRGRVRVPQPADVLAESHAEEGEVGVVHRPRLGSGLGLG